MDLLKASHGPTRRNDSHLECNLFNQGSPVLSSMFKVTFFFSLGGGASCERQGAQWCHHQLSMLALLLNPTSSTVINQDTHDMGLGSVQTS